MPGYTEFENVRDTLAPGLRDITDAQLAALLAARGIAPREMEGFLDDIGKFAAKAAPAVLPIAGQVIGSIYGGPAGGAIGNQLGTLAGGAISNLAGGQKAAPAPPAPPPAISGAPSAPTAPPAGAPSAAGQLLQTVTRPETLQALSSMAMGLMGKQNVSVGGTPVPISAFTNLLSMLAGRAEAEYNRELTEDAGQVPKYLETFSGEQKGDPAVAADRAEALYELLESATFATGREAAESESAESGEAFSEWEMEADAIEAQEMAEAAEGYESEEA